MDTDMSDPPVENLPVSARVNSLVISAFPWARPEIVHAPNLSDIVATHNVAKVSFSSLDRGPFYHSLFLLPGFC